MNQRAISHPALIVMVSTVSLLVGSFWIFNNQINLSSGGNVQGTSVKNPSVHPGFSIAVSSNNGGWDLVEYLCESSEECEEALTSGKRLGIVSGGSTEYHEVVVNYSDSWSGYSHVKYYVKPSNSNSDASFRVVASGNYPETKVITLSNNDTDYEVAISPISAVTGSFYKSVTFSDK